MEKGNRYGKKREKAKKMKVKKKGGEGEDREKQARARFSLLVSHGLVFMNGFARGLRGIVLSLLPSLSLSLFLSVAVFSLSLPGCQPASFSGGGLLQTLTHRERATIEGGRESIV